MHRSNPAKRKFPTVGGKLRKIVEKSRNGHERQKRGETGRFSTNSHNPTDSSLQQESFSSLKNLSTSLVVAQACGNVNFSNIGDSPNFFKRTPCPRQVFAPEAALSSAAMLSRSLGRAFVPDLCGTCGKMHLREMRVA